MVSAVPNLLNCCFIFCLQSDLISPRSDRWDARNLWKGFPLLFSSKWSSIMFLMLFMELFLSTREYIGGVLSLGPFEDMINFLDKDAKLSCFFVLLWKWKIEQTGATLYCFDSPDVMEGVLGVHSYHLTPRPRGYLRPTNVLTFLQSLLPFWNYTNHHGPDDYIEKYVLRLTVVCSQGQIAVSNFISGDGLNRTSALAQQLRAKQSPSSREAVLKWTRGQKGRNAT